MGISTSRTRNLRSSTPSRSYSTLGVPLDELDDELDLLAVAHRGDAEQVLDVDDAEAADLHVVLDDVAARPDDRLRGLALHVDDVVGDEPVAAHDEVERDLALADARLARGAGCPRRTRRGAPRASRSEAVSTSSRQFWMFSMKVEDRCEVRSSGTPASSAAAPISGGISRSFVTTRQAIVRAEEGPQRLDLAIPRHRLEVAHLGVAEDLHPLLVQVLGEAGEHQPGLLDSRRGEPPRESLLARDEGEAQVESLVVEERPDADRVHSGGV